jgi:hypothetical protein
MQRRDFLKSSVAVAVAAEFGIGKAQAKVSAHNWGGFDYGSGPKVSDRLNQGPFPQYAPDAVIPSDDVVMTTTFSDDAVPNYGKGLVTYITADSGTDEIKSDNIPQAIEDLVRFPLSQQLYIRPTWREVQPRPGRLELPGYIKQVFELAKTNNKRVGLCPGKSAKSRSVAAQRSGEHRCRKKIFRQSALALSAPLRPSFFSAGIQGPGGTVGG